MKFFTRSLLLLLLTALNGFAYAESGAEAKEEIPLETLQNLSKSHDLSLKVLQDYVYSYNFKCPQVLGEYQLEAIILSFDDYTELSIMMESHKENWRDIYIEARSGITCFGDGQISNAY